MREHQHDAQVEREDFQDGILARIKAVGIGLVIVGRSDVAYLAATHAYARLHNIHSSQQPDPEGSLLDAISVFSFASMNDVENYPVSDDYRTIGADETTFTDPTLSEYWTELNYSVINRLLPELATQFE